MFLDVVHPVLIGVGGICVDAKDLFFGGIIINSYKFVMCGVEFGCSSSKNNMDNQHSDSKRGSHKWVKRQWSELD